MGVVDALPAVSERAHADPAVFTGAAVTTGAVT